MRTPGWMSTVLLAAVLVQPLRAGATEPALHVRGNQLVDGAGAVVQLRGVNVSGLESVAVQGWSAGDPWGGWKPAWSALQAWRVNVIRLPLNEASWLHYPCTDDKGAKHDPDPGNNYRAAVADTVRDAVANGLFVILDLHWSAPGAYCPLGQNVMADTDHSVDFWKSVADTFKDDAAVVFELFNEPFIADGPYAWDAWRNGGGQTVISTPVKTGYVWQSAGMQKLLDTVRHTGAKNVVLVGGLNYSNNLTGWVANRPEDPVQQLAAAWHVYPDGQYRGTETGGSTQLMLAGIAAMVPVVITEVGDAVGPGGGKFAASILEFADRNGYSYLGWTWNTWGKGSNELILDAAGTPTPGFGAYFKQHLACRAEKPRCK